MQYVWEFWARPEQLLPGGDWSTWLILAGRGFGKTRSGAEATRWAVESGGYSRLTLAGATASDVRDIMIEGESGLMAVSRPGFMPVYEPSKSRVTWPNGAVATLRSADEPDRFRGVQSDFIWADELAAWRYPDSWDQLQLGHRLGADPIAVVTTTPRPTALIKEIAKSPSTRITRGSTYDNKANLAPKFFRDTVAKYEGTRLGRQELHAEILDDSPGALWKRANLDEHRISPASLPALRHIVVGIDPAVEDGENACDTGIVVVGLGENGHAYVLGDESVHDTPAKWAEAAVVAFQRHGANKVVAEINNGGKLVGLAIKNVILDGRPAGPRVPVAEVRASVGKATRAEPVAMLYEQGRVHHVGTLAKLEDELCQWDPTATKKSPDRLDALVWAVTAVEPMMRNGIVKVTPMQGIAPRRSLEGYG